MTRGEVLDKIMANFDNLDSDLSLWTEHRSEFYKKSFDDLKRAVVSLILASDEYDKHAEMFD